MIKLSNIGSFFEEHVEKIVLVIVGAICTVLLVTRVILSPNTVLYDNKNFSPSTVDDYVLEKAKELEQKLNKPPDQLDFYKPKADELLALLDSSINNVDTTLWPVVPYDPGIEARSVAGIYNLPRIGEVNDVAVEHIRAVAYIPINEVTLQNPYDKAGNEPNDLDFVTVEAKFDAKQLYESFDESFVEYVEEQHADPCLAKPIFAAVNLQRQQLNSDGTWSDWQDVPRTKIDPYQKIFQITEDVQDLPPGGLKVQMLQFDNKQMQIELLQPQAYQIASANEEWFPPVLHREFIDRQRREVQEEKRKAKEEKEERERGQDDKRNRRTDSRTGMSGLTPRIGSGFSSPGGTGDPYGSGGTNTRNRDRSRDRQTTSGYMGEGGRTGDRRRSSSRNRAGTTDPMTDQYGLYGNERFGDGRGGALRRRGPTTNDIYYDYDEIAFNRLTDFSKLKEPITFWAHDDTIEPRNTYRYRIRLGVFNPIAGTNKVSEQDISQNNKVILWSDFSSITEPVEILGRSYFFARDIQEDDKTISVTVCRYVLGHWYSEDFKVSKGEAIGNVTETETEEDRTQRDRITGGRRGDYNRGDYRGDYIGDNIGDRYSSITRPEEKANVPETIDYSTGAVMVDAMSINDWWGDSTRRSRNYYDMLYSFDGINIEHMPVGTTYWSKEMQTVFNNISKLEREPHEEFKAFNTSRRRSARPGLGEYDDMMGGYDELYDMGMMDMRGRR